MGGDRNHAQAETGPSSEGTDHIDKGPSSNELMPFHRLICYGDSLDKLLMCVGTLGAVGCGCGTPLLVLFLGEMISLTDPSQRHVLLSKVSAVCIKMFCAGLGTGLGSLLEVGGWMVTAERQTSRIRRMYLKALLRQDVAYFDQEVGVAQNMTKLFGDAMLIQDSLGDKVGNVIECLTKFVFGWMIAFVKNWKLCLICIAALQPGVVLAGLTAVGIARTTRYQQDAYAEAGKVVAQVLGSMRTVSSNSGERMAVGKYDAALGKAVQASVQLGVVNGFGLGLVQGVFHCISALSLWYGSVLVAKGESDAASVITVIFAILSGSAALGQLTPHLSAIAAGLKAAESIFQVIERKPKIDSNDLSGKILSTVRADIHLKNVMFAYPTRPEHAIFNDFNLFIKAGSTAALVGESGSGKSTVIQLIERFYDPQGGHVLLDGVDIRDLQLRWFRNQIALVSQEPVLFATSIRGNILYGKGDATQEQIEAACVLANAAVFIDRMPQGYDTQVGERGVQLSGGQKQRVAIARAILKDPRILLLDEATSALDAESERIVQEALDRVMVNRTTLVVAHRLSTIKNADVIAVVQKGVVVETGLHEDLIQRADSVYNHIIALQRNHRENTADPESAYDAGNYSGRTEHLSVLVGDHIHSKRVGRDLSSRVLGRHTRHRSSSSSISFVSDIKSVINFGSKYHDPEQVQDLLDLDLDETPHMDLESGWVGSKSAKETPTQQRIPFCRLAKMNKPELPYFIVGVLGSAGHGAILPLFAYLLSKTISSMNEPSADEVRRKTAFYALMFAALGGLVVISEPVEKICFAIVGSRLVRRLRLRSFENIVRQEVGWFDEDKNSSANLGSRLHWDAAAVRNVVGDTLTVVVQTCASIILCLYFSFSASWELSIIMLVAAPVLALYGVLTLRNENGMGLSGNEELDKANQTATEAVSNIRTVASFCAEEKVVDLYEDKTKGDITVGTRQALKLGLALGSANWAVFSAKTAVFYVGARLVTAGEVTFLDVFEVFFVFSMTAMTVAMGLRMGPDVGRARPAVVSILSLLDRSSRIDPVADKGLTLQHVKGRIEFQKVTFKYATRPTVQIFQSLSFTVSAGKNLALVGESGSGKSTVISLIERFYDVDAGTILIDNVDIKLLSLKWLRQHMGLVSQEPTLFDDTIRANIVYGMEGQTLTEDELHTAAKAANAHEFISSLPEGYDTRVGESGIQLSGGQKQRVAIARAIIRKPKILLLDEATSALDSEAELLVQNALDQIMIGRSTVVVAHRLSTVRNCDQILVLKNGQIEEKGTYDELVKAGGDFASLARQYFTAR